MLTKDMFVKRFEFFGLLAGSAIFILFYSWDVSYRYFQYSFLREIFQGGDISFGCLIPNDIDGHVLIRKWCPLCMIVPDCSDKDIQKLCDPKARRVETIWYWCTQRDATLQQEISRLNGENKAKWNHISQCVAWQELLMGFPGLWATFVGAPWYASTMKLFYQTCFMKYVVHCESANCSVGSHHLANKAQCEEILVKEYMRLPMMY